MDVAYEAKMTLKGTLDGTHNPLRSPWGVGAALLCLGGWIALSVQLDLFAAVTARGWEILVPLAINAVLAVPATLLLLGGRHRRLLPIIALAMVGLLVLAATPWHPRKRFVQRLDSVRPGMTLAQVDARMMGYRREAGEGSVTYLWDTPHGSYNADLGQVLFKGGRVASVLFLPD